MEAEGDDVEVEEEGQVVLNAEPVEEDAQSIWGIYGKYVLCEFLDDSDGEW